MRPIDTARSPRLTAGQVLPPSAASLAPPVAPEATPFATMLQAMQGTVANQDASLTLPEGTSATSTPMSASLIAAYAQLAQTAALDSLLSSGSATSNSDPLLASMDTAFASSPDSPVNLLDPSGATASAPLGLSALSSLPGATASAGASSDPLAALSAYISAAMGFEAPYTGTASGPSTIAPLSATPQATFGVQPGALPSAAPTALSSATAPDFLSTAADGPLNVQELINQLAPRYGLSPALVRAVVKQESDFSPTAHSSAGALGLMQLMPDTATALGVTDPLDPVQNLRGGMTYLSGLLSAYHGSVPLALAAYNAGPAAVNTYGGIPPYPQTQAYVAAIMDSLSTANS